MPVQGDFDRHEIYRTAAAMTNFIYELEDRFPEDEMPVLFQRLRSAAVDVGARIAEGFGRDGIGAEGELSQAAAREVLAKLSELRHYVLASQSRFFLDEGHVRAFDGFYEKIRAALRPAGGSG